MWYHNLYFLNCAAKDGATTPGLFANWSYNNIGTSWNGDYHMNYNTQQPFWVTFSSNHLEKNLPYVNLIEHLMPVSKRWATEYYEKAERALLDDIQLILSRFPKYPVSLSAKYGEVLVSVPGEHDQVVYNVPLPLFSVFPGEDYGLHSDAKTMQSLKDTYYNQQNEGGNDLVFINLQAARIGMLVNECLMQSYDGTIRHFPNWPLVKDTEFHNLRTVGSKRGKPDF